jgi:hypothetical protein
MSRLSHVKIISCQDYLMSRLSHVKIISCQDYLMSRLSHVKIISCQDYLLSRLSHVKGTSVVSLLDNTRLLAEIPEVLALFWGIRMNDARHDQASIVYRYFFCIYYRNNLFLFRCLEVGQAGRKLHKHQQRPHLPRLRGLRYHLKVKIFLRRGGGRGRCHLGTKWEKYRRGKCERNSEERIVTKL